MITKTFFLLSVSFSVLAQSSVTLYRVDPQTSPTQTISVAFAYDSISAIGVDQNSGQTTYAEDAVVTGAAIIISDKSETTTSSVPLQSSVAALGTNVPYTYHQTFVEGASGFQITQTLPSPPGGSQLISCTYSGGEGVCEGDLNLNVGTASPRSSPKFTYSGTLVPYTTIPAFQASSTPNSSRCISKYLSLVQYLAILVLGFLAGFAFVL